MLPPTFTGEIHLENTIQENDTRNLEICINPETDNIDHSSHESFSRKNDKFK